MELLAAYSGIVIIFLLLISVLWVLLPFAVFGVKPLLKSLIKNQKELLKISKQQELYMYNLLVAVRGVSKPPKMDKMSERKLDNNKPVKPVKPAKTGNRVSEPRTNW